MSSARSAKKKAPAKTASKKSTTSAKKRATPSKAKASAKKRAASPKAKTSAKKSNPTGENETVAICRQLADIVESHTLSELIVDTAELNLVIRRGDVQATGIPMMAHMAAPVSAQAPTAVSSAAQGSVNDTPAAVDDSLHEVTSPFVGTFYRSPNPESSPYCEVGQRVEKGQVLCIVEAMKLMNEIEADMAGTIETCLVDNAEPVEYGQSLFKIRP